MRTTIQERLKMVELHLKEHNTLTYMKKVTKHPKNNMKMVLKKRI